MINDKTIDADNARYWCAFKDEQLLNLLDEAGQYDTEDGKRLAKIIKAVNKNIKQKNEGELTKEGMWDFAQAAQQAAFPLTTGNPFQPNFRAMDPTSDVLSLQNQQKNNVIAASTAAVIAGASLVPGGWAALGSALASALGAVGGWLAGTAASLGTSGVLAIVGGLVSVSTYLYPRIAKLLKSICRTGELAKCKFEADGEMYLAVFSLKTKRWQLVFQSSRMLSRHVDVPASDIKEFFESKFFARFLKQCRQYADNIYDDPKRMKCLEVLSKMSTAKSKKDMQKLLDAKDVVDSYMLKGIYMTS